MCDSGIQTVQFYDSYDAAYDAYYICTVSIGWYCELYEYKKDEDSIPGYVHLM